MLKYLSQRNLNFANYKRIGNGINLGSSNILLHVTANVFPMKNEIMKKFFFTKMFTLAKMGTSASSSSFPLMTKPCNELIKYQKFFMRSMKSKRKLRAANTKYKIKNHTGLMKRIRVVGPSWNRQFKFWPTGHVHKMTNKSSANLKGKKKARYICLADIRRVRRLIPYFKRKKCKH